jgi:hypothetical protein
MINGYSQDFIQFAGERCNKALDENEGYKAVESNPKAGPSEVQAEAELICYLQGYRDAINMMNGKL